MSSSRYQPPTHLFCLPPFATLTPYSALNYKEAHWGEFLNFITKLPLLEEAQNKHCAAHSFSWMRLRPQFYLVILVAFQVLGGGRKQS